MHSEKVIIIKLNNRRDIHKQFSEFDLQRVPIDIYIYIKKKIIDVRDMQKFN